MAHLNSPELLATPKPLLLIVDDDPLITDTLSFALSPHFDVLTSHSRRHSEQLLRELRRVPQLALVDLGLPPSPHQPDEGFALILALLNIAPEVRIVVLSGQNDESNARHARTLGAVDFLPKPCDLGALRVVLERALTFRRVDLEQQSTPSTSPLIGHSPPIQKLRLQLEQYADSPFPVLIEGESGSGKEIIASYCLHTGTQRRHKPFLALNCAALSANLVEATLFGYSKGAFTGATSAKSGCFEDAADGTLFLDEIGELALDLQAKLLRVLENGEYQRLGASETRISRARIVAATNRDLRKEVRAGNFRADLYHRLSVFSISVPPLRDMGEDKLLLLEHFRLLYATQTKNASFSLSDEARAAWLHYSFPGNVRELRNVVIRLSAKYAGRVVSLPELEAEFDLQDSVFVQSSLPSSQEGAAATPEDEAFVQTASRRLQSRTAFSLDQLLAATERAYIEAALKLTQGNVSQAARLLGLNRTTLYNRIESLAKGF
ncbi:MAG: sigma-54 dependent transcriptional regulator [Pseudomonadota bacterium]